MYKSIYVDNYRSTYFINDDIQGWIQGEYKPYGYKKSKNGKLKTIFGDNVTKIPLNRDNKKDNSIFEVDLSPELRVLTDLYLDSDEIPKNNNIVYFDIETEIVGRLDAKSVREANAQIKSVAIYDSVTKKKYVLIVDKLKKLEKKNLDGIDLIPYNNEESLIKGFINLWNDLEVEYIIHFNGCFFDIPYVYYRTKKLFGKNFASKLSPLEIVIENEKNEDNPIRIAGIESLDFMRLHKKFKPNEIAGGRSLENISNHELGYGKLKYDGNLDQLYKDDILLYVKYNMNDVDLLIALEEKLKFVQLTIMIAHVAHVNCENIYYSSVILDGVIYSHLKRKGIVSPNKPITMNPSLKEIENLVDLEDDEDLDDDQIVVVDGKKKKKSFLGGFVLDPVRPLCDWLCDEDFASLYPRLAISFNCGQETMVGRVLYDDLTSIENMNCLELTIPNILNSEREISLQLMDGTVYKTDKENLVDYIIQNNFAITPNGMVFRTDEVSVICEVLQDWLDKRDLYKSKMKQSRKDLDFDMASFYDNYQMVFKTFANSIYGCLALHFFRYTTEEKYLSTAITVSGQFATRNTIKHIDKKYNKFMGTKDYKYVNYSDTDSFYVECFPMVKKILGYDVDKNENDIIIPIVEKISEEIMEDCNLFYNVLLKENMNLDKHFLQLKPEYIIKRGYWSKKKKYACYLVRKEGTPIKEGSEYDFKGLDIVKSNFNKSFKKLSKGLIIDILNGAEREDISEKILDFKDWTITCDYDDLSLPVGIKQPLEKYVDREAMKGQIFSKTTKGALSQFKASIRFNDFIKFYGLSKTHTEISIGESVKYVYLKNNPLGIDSLSYKYGEQNPQKVLDFIERYIDRNKNFDKQLLKKLQTIYDSLSWGEINLNRNKTKILKK